MARKQLVYKIGYYEEDKRFGWTNTLYDNVIAKSEKEALAKFYLKHDAKVVSFIADYIVIDY